MFVARILGLLLFQGSRNSLSRARVCCYESTAEVLEDERANWNAVFIAIALAKHFPDQVFRVHDWSLILFTFRTRVTELYLLLALGLRI